MWRNCRAKEIEIGRILRGGEMGLSAAAVAAHFDDPMWASRVAVPSPHSALLELYQGEGENLFREDRFRETGYYEYAARCIDHFETFFTAYRREDVVRIARYFVTRNLGRVRRAAGHSEYTCFSGAYAPVLVRRIRDSACFQLADGYHRLAEAFVKGCKSIPAYVLDEVVSTPMQSLLAQDGRLFGRRCLHQPLPLPEVGQEWSIQLPAEATARAIDGAIQAVFGDAIAGMTMLDVGSRYGWYVRRMLNMGLLAAGVECDAVCVRVGRLVFELNEGQLLRSPPCDVLRERQGGYDVVLCIDEVSRYLLGAGAVSAERFVELLARASRGLVVVQFGKEYRGQEHPKLRQWDLGRCIRWLESMEYFEAVWPIDVATGESSRLSGRSQLIACRVRSSRAGFRGVGACPSTRR